jgi:hypothetical protein
MIAAIQSLGSGSEQFTMYVEKNWIPIAAVAYHSHQAYGRGILQLTANGEPESYVMEAHITNDILKRAITSYDPQSTVLAFYPVNQENIFGEFSLEIPPSRASMFHKIQRVTKDGIYYGTNSTRLIRLADIEYYEKIPQLALEITETLHYSIKEPYRRDVLQLAIRLIGQSQTLLSLGSPTAPLVPRLGNRKPIVDVSSIAVIFRSILETYLTMHEVFFEPKNDNDFDFYHSRWILIGIHNAKKRMSDEEYRVNAPESIEPLRIDATKRMQNTSQYQQMLLQKKNNHDKTLDSLLQRNKEPSEWQRIAQSADISIAAYQHMYSGYSGYVHSDGLSSFQLHKLHEADFDFMAEFIPYMATGLVSKMITDFVAKYPEAEQLVNANKALYEDIKEFERRLNKKID